MAKLKPWRMVDQYRNLLPIIIKLSIVIIHDPCVQSRFLIPYDVALQDSMTAKPRERERECERESE